MMLIVDSKSRAERILHARAKKRYCYSSRCYFVFCQFTFSPPS